MNKSTAITDEARERNTRLLNQYREQIIELEPKYLLQMAHLTTPATVWKYVESAVRKSTAESCKRCGAQAAAHRLEALYKPRANEFAAASTLRPISVSAAVSHFETLACRDNIRQLFDCCYSGPVK